MKFKRVKKWEMKSAMRKGHAIVAIQRLVVQSKKGKSMKKKG
jgi:hypothetical protein